MPARSYEQEIKADLQQKRRLSSFLDGLVNSHLGKQKRIDILYIFCDDDFLLSMNEEFLGHDTLTDIITFDLSEKPKELVGEIYISIERVRENAKKFKTKYKEELHRVIFHGALHLCGFKDKTAKDKKEMREQEDKCLKEYFNDSMA